MHEDRLSWGGEFIAPQREAEYQAERLPEYVQSTRLFFQCVFIVNVLFYLNDWRFFGQPHFYAALAARTTIVMTSLICALRVRKSSDIGRLRRLVAGWLIPVIPACAILMTPHTQTALLVTFVLPAVFFLLLPLPFLWIMVAGTIASYAMLAGYLFFAPWSDVNIGLMLGMLTLDAVQMLMIRQSNRLRRLEWTATQALRAANEDLAESRTFLQCLLSAVPVPLIIMGKTDGALIQANEAAHRYFGDAAGSLHAILGYLVPQDLAKLKFSLHTKGRVDGVEAQLTLPDGSSREVLVEAVNTTVEGKDVTLAALVDITERKKMELDLRRLANSDPLTGLANRARFFAVATAEIKRTQRHEGPPLAVIMVDLDFFKRINDTYGHEKGDYVLKAFATRCQGAVRAQDLVARLGGEEFALLLPQTNRLNAVALAERLRREMEGVRPDWLSTPITISVGVSEVWRGEQSVDAALERADEALYVAKRSGRDQVVLFDATRLAGHPLDATRCDRQ